MWREAATDWLQDGFTIEDAVVFAREAKARGIFASLQITVGIKQNGEVDSVEGNRTSGYRFLDEAAKRGNAVAFSWHYRKDDEMARGYGEDLEASVPTTALQITFKEEVL